MNATLATSPCGSVTLPARKRFPIATACSRGYLGSWAVNGGRLYLTNLFARVDGKPYALEDLFPGSTGAVHAVWFTGELRLPRGKPLQYIEDYGPLKYEKEFVIVIKRGDVTGEELVDGNHADELWVPNRGTNSPPARKEDGAPNPR